MLVNKKKINKYTRLLFNISKANLNNTSKDNVVSSLYYKKKINKYTRLPYVVIVGKNLIFMRKTILKI